MLKYQENYLSVLERDRLFSHLLDNSDWHKESIHLFGQIRKVPRLIDWAGDIGLNYVYSGIDHLAKPWDELLNSLRNRLNNTLQQKFNFVLLNRYVDGRDSMGWHSDNEAGMGPVVASVSLGASRRFLIKENSANRSSAVELSGGSLLVMSGKFQQKYQHALPKTKRHVGERINLTFRCIAN